MEAPFRGTAAGDRPARPARRPPADAHPPGAVRGDPGRQPFSYRSPRSSYVDAVRRCRGCGESFVLAARDQKRWCEALGLKLDARSSLCPTCRRRWLREHGLRAALSDAARALSEAPFHAPAAIAYARAAVASAERFEGGPLDAALAALRALAVNGKAPAEALYWTGRCHEAARRKRPAGAAYRHFLSVAQDRRDLVGLRSDAEKRTRLRSPL